AEADDVAVGVDAGVLPQYVRARRVAGGTQRPRPDPAVPRARAREPGPLPAGIPSGVVEADPEPARRRIDGGRRPEPVGVCIGRPDGPVGDPAQPGVEDTDVDALGLAGPAG